MRQRYFFSHNEEHLNTQYCITRLNGSLFGQTQYYYQMTKKLLIIRHAKSDWDSSVLKDFDRPLNKRGEKNAPEMAERLVKKNLIPNQLVSSPALRAITTAGYFADVFNIKKSEIRKEQHIYEASSKTLLQIINQFDNQFNFIALFGHNPGLTELVINLCNADLYDIPTCGMVMIEFPFKDWSMISYESNFRRRYLLRNCF